jgi:hypothetical protein
MREVAPGESREEMPEIDLYYKETKPRKFVFFGEGICPFPP